MRKQVLGKVTKIENLGPRMGQPTIDVYRCVTHLAKDKYGPDIKEAWEYLYTFFGNESDQVIKNKILSIFIQNKLDIYENPITVIYNNSRIIKYYDYDLEKELPEFNIRRLI